MCCLLLLLPPLQVGLWEPAIAAVRAKQAAAVADIMQCTPAPSGAATAAAAVTR